MRRLRVLGHPLHPVTVHVPLGLLLVVPVADLMFPWASPFLLGVGLFASAPALVTGFLDYVSIPPDAPHSRVATAHLGCAGGALILFATSVALRLADAGAAWAIACSALGAALLVGTGWLGGELVYRYGEGVVSAESIE